MQQFMDTRKILTHKEYLVQIQEDLQSVQHLLDADFDKKGIQLNGVALNNIEFKDDNIRADWERLMKFWTTDIVEFLYRNEHLIKARYNDVKHGNAKIINNELENRKEKRLQLFYEKSHIMTAADMQIIKNRTMSMIQIENEEYSEIEFEIGCIFLEEIAENDNLKNCKDYWKWVRIKVYQYNNWFLKLRHANGSDTVTSYKKHMTDFFKRLSTWKSFEYHRDNIFGK